MALLLNVVLAWLAYLNRPFVLVQLLLLAGSLLLVQQLRLRWPALRRLPWTLPLLAGLGLLSLVLQLAGQRSGLVQLAGQVCLGWLLLGQLERRLFRPRLPRAQYQVLVSRLLRPCFMSGGAGGKAP